MAPDAHPPRSPLRWLDAPWIDPAWAIRAFDRQLAVDPFGLRVHTAIGALWCLFLGAPISPSQLAGIPLAAAFLIRIHRHWATFLRLIIQPPMLLILLWSAWAALSLLWSPDPSLGFDQASSVRWFAAIVCLWPVVQRRALLLAAMTIGIALGQLGQVGHAIGTAFDVDWLVRPRLPGRNSGWWFPVVGGSILTAALGLHLPAAVWGRGKWRTLGIAGCLCTIAGIAATGTRGAWIASAALVLIVGVAAGWRAARWRGLALACAAATLLIVVAGTAAWTLGGQSLRDRVSLARVEITSALRDGEYNSDTGARIAMAGWAVAAFAEHPLSGTGSGGYRRWVEDRLRSRGIDPATRSIHDHAHNALLHTAATAGLPGLAIAAAFIVCVLRGAARRQPGDGPPGYADGPFWALLGLLLVSAFDVVHINAQTSALLGALVFFSLPWRPPPPEPAA
ncbi:MAG: O-antigen ligase family protein [Phycisphaeraceae bacterium]|nr:O-antigen ligase family protein [Phycisphaeraceae bacterium]